MHRRRGEVQLRWDEKWEIGGAEKKEEENKKKKKTMKERRAREKGAGTRRWEKVADVKPPARSLSALG